MPYNSESIEIDAKYLAKITDNILSIIDKSTYKTIQIFDLKDETISLVAIDPSLKYIFIGTHSGRILQYSFTNHIALSRICSFSHTLKQNYMNNFTFYENSVAFSSCTGEVIVLDIDSLNNKNILNHAINKLLVLSFVDTNTLISATQEGSIFISSLLENTTRQFSTPCKNIKQIVVFPDKKYLLICYDKRNIALIDLKKFQCLNKTFLTYKEEIQDMSILQDGELVLTFNNKQTIKTWLTDTTRLSSLILHNSLDEAFRVVAQNPLLQSSLEYQELQKHYNTLYRSALEALQNGNKALALQLTEIFKTIPDKYKKIKLLFEAFKHYERFKILIEEEKYYIAYPMSEKFPPLQESDAYLHMQEVWKKSFLQSQKLLLQHKKEDAKRLLNKFIHIEAKRKLILLLLHNNKEFIAFLQAIESVNFEQIDILSKKNKIFLTTPVLTTLKNRIEDTIKEIKISLDNNDISSANELLEQLHKSTFYKKEIQKLQEKYSYCYILEDAYNENDFLRCYETMDTYEYLKNTRLGKMLQKHWSKLILQCEHYALNGDMQAIKITLAELLLLPSRREKIGNLLRVCFQSKITQLLERKEFKNCENFIYSYLDIFGNDKEIFYIMNRFESLCNYTLAITNKRHTHDRDGWIHSTLIL